MQRLRALAHKNGKLEFNDHQTVKVEQDVEETSAGQPEPSGEAPSSQQVIVIEPTSPETVYVPYYQPSVVYGGWPYPDYPPYYFRAEARLHFRGSHRNGARMERGLRHRQRDLERRLRLGRRQHPRQS